MSLSRAPMPVSPLLVDYDGTASFASSGVPDDVSSFKFESSMRSYGANLEAELDERFRWIEFQSS